MQFTICSTSARRLLALTTALAIGACTDDGALTSPDQKLFSNSGTGTTPTASSDTVAGSPSGEWHLKTIRGVLRGLIASDGPVSGGDSLAALTPIIAGATIEIHKISLDFSKAASGDSAAFKTQDLGVVATVTTDASGKFQYVLSEPIIVKTGQPSPNVTYRMTATPPAGSPFVARSDIQVFFMEQFPANSQDVPYYLFPPKR